ncbi:endoribonuclease YBEY, chloroplastic isoform X1 [Oryza sativa Japonica Group]|uniref:Haloacid dehalogenase-like hydrolase-like protein n=2 Tax=Oryza sativa subsp. japonica TaxID=39947 RepID=A0A0P0XMZ7_ORYSJ|nr:endoribonuclease YBEY, chloroplastic isoform X1 [Oryza sativa Japonica Group]KAF2916025.1 hypothetical protein DAI22_09g086300 [Oryza sativa Japonica Group]BAD26068.1 haloacid dehalogenase-like hydrolase-like protein [Oryza sativa Japonica Group]BAF24994.1 Os09g0388400 [Oryza sativa Japonica Group]BAG91534.1 unnamed protein product [Oryza sativa Japonica Group]BAT07894.1 Os09g0388400 [Oryza sativa Japonica Group]|eukprot:NP_001063080.1 Os09g0388400 [Oryza sativa Japonica Group]
MAHQRQRDTSSEEELPREPWTVEKDVHLLNNLAAHGGEFQREPWVEKDDAASWTVEKDDVPLVNNIVAHGDPEGSSNSLARSGGHLANVHEGAGMFYQPNFKYIFCDMDGTLLDSSGLVPETNAEAIRVARSRGVQTIIATGKSRPAVIEVLGKVNLAGTGGIVSESSPGVFLQGLLVYGEGGQKLYQQNLDIEVCREALLYSLKHRVALVAFSQDDCYTTLDDHPLVDFFHVMYHEPKAKIISDVDHFLSTIDIQKFVFLETPEVISSVLRPHWARRVDGKAQVVQAQGDVLEVVPLGTSKGNGVKILLESLCASPDEVMALGDGKNDKEMLQLAGLGVALCNGCEVTKVVADVIGASNDESGVAQAIYKYL